MTHSCIGLFSSLHESLGGSPVATDRSPKVRAPLGYLSAEVLRRRSCEMPADLSWRKWSDQDAFTNLLAALPNLCLTNGDSIATPSSFYVNPDAVQFNVSSDNWNYPS
jgi:DNA-binding SARP family transcriptional activator